MLMMPLLNKLYAHNYANYVSIHFICTIFLVSMQWFLYKACVSSCWKASCGELVAESVKHFQCMLCNQGKIFIYIQIFLCQTSLKCKPTNVLPENAEYYYVLQFSRHFDKIICIIIFACMKFNSSYILYIYMHNTTPKAFCSF